MPFILPPDNNKRNPMHLRTLLVLLLLCPLASAHHGIANFDLNKDVGFTGVIRDIAFVNPHSWLYVDVTNPDGSVTAWKCELRGATVLRRSGWTKEMFVIGSEVTLTGAPDRFDSNTCYMGSIAFADGSSMDRYGQLVAAAPIVDATNRPATLANGRPNLAGDWASEQRVMTDPRGISGAFLPLSVAEQLAPGEVPAGGRAFPGARGTPESLAADPIRTAWERTAPVTLTAAGEAAIAGFDGASSANPRLRCEPTNILFDWSFDTHVNRIEQTDTSITLHYGFMGLVRTIPLDQTRLPAQRLPSRSGHALGHWEGSTLVVETRGFLPGILSADARTPHSAQMVVIERFSLDTGNNTLVREYTATDPLYFAGEYRGRDELQLADLAYEPYACDDRSYRSDLQ